MRIREFRDRFIAALTPIYDAAEAENFFHMLLEEYRGLKRVDLAMHPDLELEAGEFSRWNAALEGLKREIPIQYIIGKAHFYGLEFYIGPDVLIPRPETEELVEWVVSDNEFAGSPKILDIGTGSGCIAVSLAKNLRDAAVWALDVSHEALHLAKRNAQHNGTTVHFVEADILQVNSLGEPFDIIVSNPPYVRHLEKAEIRDNVLAHEPHLALFVDDDDALVFYRKIADFALENLTQNGQLYLEINQYLGPETVEMLKGKGFLRTELHKDMFGNDRMIKCVAPHHS